MKILVITDGADWCLDKLAQVVIRGNPQFEFRVLPIHPKEVAKGLAEAEKAIEWADITWHQYFRTGAQLAELLPHLFAGSGKKHILTHHNQRDEVFKHDQNWVTHFACHTEKMREKLAAKYPQKPCAIIRHGIDLDEFGFDETEYPPTKHQDFVVGYAGRTKPWKRLVNIFDAVKSIPETLLVGMGKRDDAYAHQIDWSDPRIEWHENVRDDERVGLYRQMNCFVQYSEDGIEEGTMPLLEAMAAGIPIITSPVGTARDVIKDGHNGLVAENDEQLKRCIELLKENPELCEKLRMNAWETIKGFSEPAMALGYEKLFWRVMSEKDLVSIVIPTYKRPELLEKILESIETQTYPAIEVIIADDDPEGDYRRAIVPDPARGGENFEALLPKWRRTFNRPIKYVRTENEGYGLAQARNLGAIEGVGHYLMFLDDRYALDQEAVMRFVESLSNQNSKTWVFGDKGSQKREFVENFGMLRRQDFIDMGMFNERITAYGGMSQEIRMRGSRQNIQFVFVPEAKCETLHQTRRKHGRRADIWRMKHQLKRMGL